MKSFWKSSLLLGLLATGVAGCGDDTTTKPPVEEPTNPETVQVTEDIKGDTTWKTGNTYVLTKHVFVESGTLTIEPGVTVKGQQGSSLVITREAKLRAVGTAEKPIVFTSAAEVGSRAAGNWGGVVMLGKAHLNIPNVTEQSIEGFVVGSDARTLYGGTNDAHDCGSLKYVRIEFAGFKLLNNSELNGLSMGACGSETQVDYLQVHRGLDDGVEMFGGTANLKHVVVTLTDDDGLDWDFGYRGNVQFLIVQQGENLGNNGIEADNYANAPTTTPLAQPELWNVTLVGRPAGGSEKPIGMTLKAGTAGKLNNFIVMDFASGAIDVNDSAGTGTAARVQDGSLFIKNSLFWNLVGQSTGLKAEATDNDKGLDENAAFVDNTVGPQLNTGNRFADPMLTAASDTLAPNFQPKAGSPALNPDVVAPTATGGFFDTTARFIGAVGTTDWTAGWTVYPKN
jgi:hypothetical protein